MPEQWWAEARYSSTRSGGRGGVSERGVMGPEGAMGWGGGEESYRTSGEGGVSGTAMMRCSRCQVQNGGGRDWRRALRRYGESMMRDEATAGVWWVGAAVVCQLFGSEGSFMLRE